MGVGRGDNRDNGRPKSRLKRRGVDGSWFVGRLEVVQLVDGGGGVVVLVLQQLPATKT